MEKPVFKKFEWYMSESYDNDECYIYGAAYIDEINEDDYSHDKYPYFNAYLEREINKRAKQSRLKKDKTYVIEEETGGKFSISCAGYDTEHDTLNTYFEDELEDVIKEIINDFNPKKEEKETYESKLNNFRHLCWGEAKGRKWNIWIYLPEKIAIKVEKIGLEDFNEKLKEYPLDCFAKIDDQGLLEVDGNYILKGEPAPPEGSTFRDECCYGFSRLLKLAVLDILATPEDNIAFTDKHDISLGKLLIEHGKSQT